MLPDLVLAGRLVDAHRPDRSAAFPQHLCPDPADVVGHLLVAHLLGSRRCLLQLFGRLPRSPSQDHIRLHGSLPLEVVWSTLCPGDVVVARPATVGWSALLFGALALLGKPQVAGSSPAGRRGAEATQLSLCVNRR